MTANVFLTVQIGVYGKPSRNSVLNTYTDLHVEKLPNSQIRYTSGKFQTLADVIKQRDFCRANGIPDAFITAYKNGKRMTVPEAKKELGIQ
jgi:Cys-tRNA synthase (O-phospho-L-seryl-tRNA:Cys-tRNA synthase)